MEAASGRGVDGCACHQPLGQDVGWRTQGFPVGRDGRDDVSGPGEGSGRGDRRCILAVSDTRPIRSFF
jgi:hypothetical protein